jgi:hypothetical protein
MEVSFTIRADDIRSILTGQQSSNRRRRTSGFAETIAIAPPAHGPWPGTRRPRGISRCRVRRAASPRLYASSWGNSTSGVALRLICRPDPKPSAGYSSSGRRRRRQRKGRHPDWGGPPLWPRRSGGLSPIRAIASFCRTLLDRAAPPACRGRTSLSDQGRPRWSRAGVRPAKAGMFSRRQTCRGTSQSPVLWIAEVMETETLKPIDKVSLGEATSHRAVTKVNALWPRK